MSNPLLAWRTVFETFGTYAGQQQSLTKIAVAAEVKASFSDFHVDIAVEKEDAGQTLIL